jgi:hypothetical protein
MKAIADAHSLLDELRGMPAETEWLDFKEAKRNFDLDDLGRYVSALSNEANLGYRHCAWLVLGVMDRRDPVTHLRIAWLIRTPRRAAGWSSPSGRTGGDAPPIVKVCVYGREIDAAFGRALLSALDLSLEEVIALDRVQKKRAGLDAKHYKALVLQLLALGPQPRSQINDLRDGTIEAFGGKTRAAKWRRKPAT